MKFSLTLITFLIFCFLCNKYIRNMSQLFLFMFQVFTAKKHVAGVIQKEIIQLIQLWPGILIKQLYFQTIVHITIKSLHKEKNIMTQFLSCFYFYTVSKIGCYTPFVWLVALKADLLPPVFLAALGHNGSSTFIFLSVIFLWYF